MTFLRNTIGAETAKTLKQYKSLWICFSELYPDVLSECLGCPPAVWPYHTQCFNYDDEDEEEITDPEYTYGLWSREENRELLRKVLIDRRGFWTNQDCVLIPSDQTWVCKEMEEDLKLVCCDFPSSMHRMGDLELGDIQSNAFVRLTETCGWCAMIEDFEHSAFWFMFRDDFAEKAEEIYKRMATAKPPARKLMILGNDIHMEEYDTSIWIADD